MHSLNPRQDIAVESDWRESVEGRGREGFRPVALPALAAAVHISNAAARSARAKLAAQRTVRIVHEDEPSV